MQVLSGLKVDYRWNESVALLFWRSFKGLSGEEAGIVSPRFFCCDSSKRLKTFSLTRLWYCNCNSSNVGDLTAQKWIPSLRFRELRILARCCCSRISAARSCSRCSVNCFWLRYCWRVLIFYSSISFLICWICPASENDCLRGRQIISLA